MRASACACVCANVGYSKERVNEWAAQVIGQLAQARRGKGGGGETKGVGVWGMFHQPSSLGKSGCCGAAPSSARETRRGQTCQRRSVAQGSSGKKEKEEEEEEEEQQQHVVNGTGPVRTAMRAGVQCAAAQGG